jgi:tetratricopeptide (TPR) repeat protein
VLVEAIMDELFSYDPEFAKYSEGDDLPAETGALMARMWHEHPLSIITTGVSTPAPSWEDFGQSYGRMLSARERLSEDSWAAAANVAEEAGKTDPTTGVLLGMLVAAGWQGSMNDPSDGEEFTALSTQAWPAWGTVFLPLANSLLRANGSWTAQRLCGHAISSLSGVGMPHSYSPERSEILQQFLENAATAARNIKAASDELVWRLAEHGADPGSPARENLAALCWLLGDAPRARVLSAGTGPPSFDCLNFVVGRCLEAVPEDPFLEAVWQRMADQGTLELSEELAAIYYRLTRAARSQIVSFDRTTQVGPRQERISRLAFQTLTAFLAGRQQDIDMGSLAQAAEVAGDKMRKLSLAAFVRFIALVLLARTPSASAEDEALDERWRWEKLVHTVNLALWWATVEHGEALLPDVTSDLPFFYLASRSPGELTSALEWLEGYRAAELEYALSVMSPVSAPAGDDRLRAELRGLRYLQVLERLPTHAGYRYGSPEEMGEGGPLSNDVLFDRARNEARQLQVRERLEQTAGGLLYRPKGLLRLRPGSGRVVIDFRAALEYGSAQPGSTAGESDDSDQDFEQRLSRAKALRDREDFASARAELESALTMAEARHGPDDARLAEASTKLGNVLQDLDDYRGAERCYERALAIDEAIYGQIHRKVGVDRYNLGTVAYAQEDLRRSRLQLERAVAIDEGVYGTEHAEVAHDRMTLGMVLEELGDIASAREQYRLALDARKSVYGPDHPAVADAAQALAAAEQLASILEEGARVADELRGQR